MQTLKRVDVVSHLTTDPLLDPRWKSLLQNHPKASVFHTPEWLEALRRTYGYEPVAYTTSAPSGQLANGIVFCRIKSWLTGHRLVSLPFSDHCEPLVEGSDELRCLMAGLREEHGGQWKYVEIRPVTLEPTCESGFQRTASFCFHSLDLRPGAEGVFRSFHKDCVRRKIRRAEREGLTCEEGRSDVLLRKFYGLMVVTRRRHMLLPQPLAWFRNLRDCLGESLKIWIASKDGRAVSAILMLRFKKTLVYKYACSDARFRRLGGTQMLLWKAIREGIEAGLEELDMGRSEVDAPGLIAFKNRWGSSCTTLCYWRYPANTGARTYHTLGMRAARGLLAHAPGNVLTAAGSLLYRHLG